MFTDRNQLEEYPFLGQFYTTGDNMPEDGDMLDEGGGMGEAEETLVLETECDIQATNKMYAGNTSGSFLDIYFPFDTEVGVDVRIGHRFRSSNWSRPVDGRVVGVVPSQMGGCLVNIREIGVDIIKD